MKQYCPSLTVEIVVGCIAIGIVLGLLLDIYIQNDVEEVDAHEPEVVVEEPQVVRIEVVYNWDTERIKEEIRNTFPESPERALAIAYCESGYKMIQSHHVLSYGRERSFGIFQIHAPDWHHVAVELGYKDYQTDIRQNIQMARYIYDESKKRTGNGWKPWTCNRMV